MTRMIARWMALAALAAGAACAQLTVSCPALPQLVGTVLQGATQVTCSATGGQSPYTFSITAGALPPNLSMDASGDITGTVTDPAGTYNFTVTATDSTIPTPLTGSQPYSVTTVDPVTVSCTSASGPVEAEVQYTNQCTAAGGTPPYNWSITGSAVPSGMAGAITQTGNPATINYTPLSAMASYKYQVVVTDSTAPTALTNNQSFSGAIAAAVSITTSSPLPPGAVGTAYSQQFEAAGGVIPYSWSATGLTGTGLSMTGGGLLKGTPASSGQLNFTVTVTDGAGGSSGALPFTLTVTPALTITTTSPLSPAATIGGTYSQQFVASGGSGTYTWSVSGQPGWLTMSSAGVLANTASAVPSSAVTSTFTVNVTDTNNNSASGSFTLPVTLVITTTPPLATATIGTAYSAPLAAEGGTGTYTWSATGLPSWLALNSSTGALTGLPPATAVNASFTVKVTDSASATASAPFTVTVAMSITTASALPPADVNAAYSQTLTASGGAGGYTWSSATLPGWLALNSATGALTGIPASAGPVSFSVTVKDSSGTTQTGPFTLQVYPALTINTSSPLANGAVGAAYNQTLAGTGGVPPSYTWAVTSGSLPNGLTLDASSGVINGTPTVANTFTFTIQLSDSASPPYTTAKQFVITIGTGLTITSAATLPNATVGVGYSQTLAATGGAPPYTWSATGLPAWLTLSTAGALSGTPTAIGTASFQVTVTDTALTAKSLTFALTTVTPPVITTVSPLPNGTAGVAYSQNLAATGGTAPYKWAVVSGSLPGGLSLSTAGAITGVPTGPVTANFTAQLTDATGITASKALTLTIITSLVISTTSPLPAGEVAIPYSQTLAATGGTPPYTWSVTGGSLPQGLTLGGSGVLSGTPNTAGAFSFTVQVADSNHVAANTGFTLTIAGVLGITTPTALSSGSVNAGYAQNLAASAGVSPYTWTLAAGPLPLGLALSSVGAITGFPTTAGTFSFTAKVTDALGATASRTFTITIVSGLTISSPATLPGATVGVAYSDLLLASGGVAPYAWTITGGSPPSGVSLKTDGTLTGVPTATGSFSFAVQVTDSLGHQASEQVSLTVAATLSITTATLPGGVVGASYSQSLAASGGTPPYSWTIVSGALPGALSLSAAGAITGTINAAGTFTFTVQVTDSASATATRQLSITAAAGLSITTAAALPNGSIHVAYSQTLAAAGGTPPYTWALTGGALPSGLTLSSAGAITGAPTATGPFSFTATVTDSASGKASQQFTLIVAGGLTLTTTSLPDGKIDTAYNQVLAASGGTPPYTFTKTAGSLPPGITLAAATLSGTPTTAGSYTFTITVTDFAAATAAQQFTIVITSPVAAKYSGIPVTAASDQPFSATLVLGAPYPLEITGQIKLTFQPDASLSAPTDDPAIMFSDDGRTLDFTIPANSTAPVPFAVQTGSVAGTITLTVSWQAGGASLAVPATLTQSIQIAPAIPAITEVTATITSSGFQVQITGYSNTRELSQAQLQFTAASGQTLQTTSLTVQLTSAATAWFQSSTSDQSGSTFVLTLPFTVSNGTASAIASVSVELVNSQGASTSASGTL